MNAGRTNDCPCPLRYSCLIETPGENLPTSRITKCSPDDATSKLTSVATCFPSLTNSIAIPALVETGTETPKYVCCWFLSMIGPQLLTVTGDESAARAPFTPAAVQTANVTMSAMSAAR